LKALEKRFGWLAENLQFGKHRTHVTESYNSFLKGVHAAFYPIREKDIDVIDIPHKEMDIITLFYLTNAIMN
jgi:toxin ParE1/3/4